MPNPSQQKSKTVSKSVVVFEYDNTFEHTAVIHLLRSAIKNADIQALLELHKHIKDVRTF